MTIIAELNIPRMFTAYAEDLGHIGSNSAEAWCDNAVGLHHYQYYCRKCNQVFSSAWGVNPHSAGYERGNHFHCTWCGERHQENALYVKAEEVAPDKMRLVVKEFKEVVVFEIYYETVEFGGYLGVSRGDRHKEVFRFDIAKQTCTFEQYAPEVFGPVELGNPFELTIFKQSVLQYFLPNCMAYAEIKPELQYLLKVLRDTVRDKLQRRLGHRVASMYVSPGQHHGLFLLPVFNMAYRLACPDAPNLPAAYRHDIRTIHAFWNSKMLQWPQYKHGQLLHTFSEQNTDYMNTVINQNRRSKDFITALIETFSLPDKPMVRKALIDDPFGVILLQKSFTLCRNYDFALQVFQGLPEGFTSNVWEPRSKIVFPNYPEGLFRFLKIMRRIYGEAGATRLAVEAKDLNLSDCIRLYVQLNRTMSADLTSFHFWGVL